MSSEQQDASISWAKADTVAEGFRELHVWQRSIELAEAIYHLTKGFPREELYGLTSQLRRAGVSVASNIAEGWGRKSNGEYKQFLGMAKGSNAEVLTQIVLARRLVLGTEADRAKVESLASEVNRMLASLMRTL